MSYVSPIPLYVYPKRDGVCIGEIPGRGTIEFRGGTPAQVMAALVNLANRKDPA